MISQPFDLFFWFFNQIDLFFWFLNQILICSFDFSTKFWFVLLISQPFDLFFWFLNQILIFLDLSWSLYCASLLLIFILFSWFLTYRGLEGKKNHNIPYSHEILYCASLLDLYIIFVVLDLVLQTTAPLLLILIFSWSLKTLCSFTTAPLPLILIFSWSLILCFFTMLHCLWS